jgi:photosystem II stability/assembly factor-like uncharacterized protein
MTHETQLQDIVYALAVSPAFEEDGLCFAARPTGLFRSQDGARTWQDAYASLDLQAALTTAAVVLSPAFETDRTLFAGVSGGVLRSIDAGLSWHVASFPPPPPFVSCLAISPHYARDGTLFAATLEDGVFRSADRGQHWAAWNFGLLDLNVLALAISPHYAQDETLFAATESGIFRSTNGARAWREVDFPPDWAPVLCLALSPAYAQDATLFAGSESHGLFRSQDGGTTWQRLAGEQLDGALNSIILAPDFPDRPEVLVLHEDALRVSRNGGQTWTGWSSNVAFEAAVASVAAPQGLAPGAPLLLGLMDGSVLRV